MKRKLLLPHILYYTLSLFVYLGFFYGSVFLFRHSGGSGNLGAAIVGAYAIMFVFTPLMAAILTRFSLLRWVVDPFAAAEIPLFLYVAMLIDEVKQNGSLSAAFTSLHETLCRNEGEGWFFLVCLFFFGLVVSLSIARTKGESISYKILAKLSAKKTSA